MDEARREDDPSSEMFADEEAPAEEGTRQGLGEEDGEEDSDEGGNQEDTGIASGRVGSVSHASERQREENDEQDGCNVQSLVPLSQVNRVALVRTVVYRTSSSS